MTIRRQSSKQVCSLTGPDRHGRRGCGQSKAKQKEARKHIAMQITNAPDTGTHRSRDDHFMLQTLLTLTEVEKTILYSSPRAGDIAVFEFAIQCSI